MTQHHLLMSQKTTNQTEWLTLVHILNSKQKAQRIPISKTMIPKALREVTILYQNTIITLENKKTISFHNIKNDTLCRFTNVLTFSKKLDVFFFIIESDLYVLDCDIIFKIYTFFTYLIPQITSEDLQMDVVYKPQTRHHIVLFFVNKEVIVVLAKDDSVTRKCFDTRINDLTWTFWICDEHGGYLGSNFSLMYSSATDTIIQCVDTIIKIDYLYNVGRWLVHLFGDCLLLDNAGMRDFALGKHSMQFVSAIDCSKFINCTHISTTSTEIHLTSDHSMILYEFKNRICLAQTIHPFNIYPNIKIDKPLNSFDPLLKIHYNEREKIIKLFCINSIYTFNMFANSLTDSTSIETTLE